MRSAIIGLLCICVVSCVRLGQPSDEENQQLSQWSQLVTEKDRTEVQRQANVHTDWMEKQKVQWMTQQYRTRFLKRQNKAAATQSSTKPTTGRS